MSVNTAWPQNPCDLSELSAKRAFERAFEIWSNSQAHLYALVNIGPKSYWFTPFVIQTIKQSSKDLQSFLASFRWWTWTLLQNLKGFLNNAQYINISMGILKFILLLKILGLLVCRHDWTGFSKWVSAHSSFWLFFCLFNIVIETHYGFNL